MHQGEFVRRTVDHDLHGPYVDGAGGDRQEAWSRFVAHAARATACLNRDEWVAAKEAVDRALDEVRPFTGQAKDGDAFDVAACWIPDGLAAHLVETLLVGLRAAYLTNDLAAALPFGRAALKTAGHFGLSTLEARAHNDLASLYGRRDFHERALHHLRSGVEVLENAGLPVLPQLLTNLGNVYLGNQRLDEALGCFQRGREGFEAAGDAFGAAIARSNEGRLLVMTGKAKKGVAALKEALEAFSGLERRAYVAVTLSKIGTACAALGDSVAAEGWFRDALIAMADEPLPFRGEVHESYGAFLLECGRAEEALEQFEAAEERCKQSGSDGPAVALLRSQSRALAQLGRHHEAYERLSRHIDLTAQLDRERGEVLLGVMLVELETGLAGDHELPALTTRVLSEANRALRDQARRLERISSTDDLTQLYNRRYLNRRLRDELLRGYREGAEVSLVLLDIDGFKAINDRFSHLIGDEVLKKMAKVLTGTFRHSDVVARWGGEEFAVLLPETDKQSAALIAEKARTAVADADWQSLAPDLAITVSAGVATASEAGPDSEGMGLLRLADRRLYGAKDAGRNCTTAF